MKQIKSIMIVIMVVTCWPVTSQVISKQVAYNHLSGLLDWTCSYTQDGRIDTLARYDEGILRSLLVGDSCFVSNDTLWHQAHAVIYYPSGCIEAEYDYRWADGDDPEIDWGYESNKKSYPDCCTMIILDSQR